MKSLFVAVLCIVPAFSQTGPDSLSPARAVQIGLENNFAIRLSRIEVQKGDNTRLLKTGALLPSLRAEGSVGYAKTQYDTPAASGPGSNSEATTTSVGATLGWTLFDGFRMFYAWHSVEQQARLSEIASRHTIESAVVSIIAAWHNLASTEALLDVSKAVLTKSKALLDRALTQQEFGRATRREILVLQVMVNTDSSVVASRELDGMRARHELNRALGRKPDTPIILVEDPTTDSLQADAATWYNKAREHNAGLQMAQIRRNIADSQRGIARSAYWPILSANGGIHRIYADADYTRTTAGITLTWPLFTGFRTLTAARNAQLDTESATLSIQQKDQELESLVFQQWELLQSTRRFVDFERNAVALAEMSLNISEEQYRLGAISDIQFREAQIALISTTARLQSAHFQNKLVSAQLKQLAGELKVR